MACPTSEFISGCDFVQAMVDELPHFDEVIMRDITPTDGWLLNIATGTEEVGTPPETTQDRFRGVWPNTTKVWNAVANTNLGCSTHPCDPAPNMLGWGADRLTYRAEEQVWESPLLCYNQMMRVTHAVEHLRQITDDVFRPATSDIASNFLRKRHLQWAGGHGMPGRLVANRTMDTFTYTWTLGGVNLDEEIFFDCSVDPNNVFLLAPQMLQNQFAPLMRAGYAGQNPFKDTVANIELVTSADVAWGLEKLASAGGNPSVQNNWRFTQWDAANKYWRYGFSGMIGNYMWRADELGLRFQYVTDLGAGAAPNRYRYQVIQPYYNEVTSGAGGSPGIGRVPNPAFDRACFQISQISHKKGMELLVPSGGQINPQTPFSHISFGGQWKWLNHDLGADQAGRAITNKWGNKGQFGAWFQYKIRPLHTEFMQAWFHKREQFCVPEINTCTDCPGYPVDQDYNSELPTCPE